MSSSPSTFLAFARNLFSRVRGPQLPKANSKQEKRPGLPHFTPAPHTREELDYVDLTIIDLAKARTPEGRAELVPQLREALATKGFFYAINHGYTQTQTDRIFDIADLIFAGVSAEEKKLYTGDIEALGAYQGYKPRRYWKIDDGFDEIEHYNIHRKVTSQEHPQALHPFLSELEDFARHNHNNILLPVLRLLALGLELSEDDFVKHHNFEAQGQSSVRFMKYYPQTEAEGTQTKNVYLKGHTDIGGVTILWSQPVAGLQILSPEGKWQWVRHIDNALVINSGDVLQFLSGNYYKPTIHRVIQPPSDQRKYARLGAFYFSMPDDDLKLVPYVESPVLKRVGITRLCEDDVAPTMEEWRKGRSIAYGRTQLKMSIEEGVEEEVVRGVVVKHYN